MLRNRSPRAVTSKQAKMGDHTAPPSPIENQRKPISYFLASPRLFKGFVAKGGAEFEPMMSPTSILDSNKPFSTTTITTTTTLGTHFLNLPKTPEATFLATKHSWENFDSRGIGLLLDSANCEKNVHNFAKPIKLQVPPSLGYANCGVQTEESHRVIIGSLTASEMELSEDYTCVISHGPNPKTTHIYDNCIVESCCGVVGLSGSKECSSFSDDSSFQSESFLSFCYTCKTNLGHEKDIYIYRGDKAFCSRECRIQEMMFDGIDNLELDDAFRT